MLYVRDKIPIEANFFAVCRERGKIVPGTHREGHNVFTNTGRDWITHLVAWQTVGSPDIPFTNRRVRWMGVGSGTQLETAGVTQLATPLLADPVNYLIPTQLVEFPAPGFICQIYSEFETGQISFPPNTVVPVTEAGMFVDVFPVSLQGGFEDSSIGPSNTTLNPTIPNNAPVAYHAFEVINKTADFILEIRWELRF